MKSFQKQFFSLLLFAILSLMMACSSQKSKEQVWIYTSAYPATVQRFDAALRAKYPELDPQWFQNGSENVAAKIALERLSKDVRADLVLTSDIFWYQKMEKEGVWEAEPPYSPQRISVMVLGYNKKSISDAEAPKKFADLADPKWQGKITSGSPLESGTSYTLMINLVYKYGYDFLKALRANQLVSAGGNGAALTRMVSGERPVAMILLENLLAEQKKNADIGIVYPEDGAILAPSPLGIVKGSKHLAAAKKVYEFLLSPEGQMLSVQENMYAPNTSLAAPQGAKPFVEVQATAFPMTKEFFDFVAQEDAVFKTKFSEIILN